MEVLKHQLELALAWRKGDVRAAEDSPRAQALFPLGEDVAAQRIADARLAPFPSWLEHAR